MHQRGGLFVYLEQGVPIHKSAIQNLPDYRKKWPQSPENNALLLSNIYYAKAEHLRFAKSGHHLVPTR